MRTMAAVLALIVVAGSEPARLFKAIIDSVIALLRFFHLA